MEKSILNKPYEIRCKVSTSSVLHSDLVKITWIGPKNDIIATDNGRSVSKTISDGNNHTSVLKFIVFRSKFDGLYTCKVTILNNTYSKALNLVGEYASGKSFYMKNKTIK